MRDVFKAALVAFALSAAFAAPVAAGPLEDGVAAYERGDYAAAFRLMRPLAEQGDASAQFNLGIMYSEGKGVTHDHIQAHMWFNLAAARGEEKARENRDIVAKQMTTAQVVEAQRLAREWRPK